MTTPPPPTRRLDPLQRFFAKKRNRAIAAAALGGAIGLTCAFLPPAAQTVCHVAAKILGLLVGGS